VVVLDARSWVFDLVARDDGVRGRALARHQTLMAASRAGQHWVNDVWERAGTSTPAEPDLAAEMDQARAYHSSHRSQTIFGYLDRFLAAEPQDTATRAMYGPFVLVYLRWEGDYPDEWRSPDSNHGSPWTCKEVVLGRLARYGVPDEIRPATADLIITAIGRPYRCKDWMYGQLVRYVADAAFLDGAAALLDARDPLVRLRARFVLDLIEYPERRVKRSTWRRWLEACQRDHVP
jgi:hypothetical protein